MIYVTGDTHGDLSRFKSREMRRLRRQDTLVVLGDFGFVWDAGARERRALRALARRRYQILFVDGSHENFDLLEGYPQVEFAGGRAWQLGPRLYRLERGGLYTIEDRKLLAFGGGESLDREARQPGETWWPQETPTPQDYERCEAALAAAENRVDAILTHDGPARLLSFLKLERDTVLYEESVLEKYFDELMQRVKYSRWCFGRYHLDQNLGPSAAAVYRRVLPLFGEEKRAGR